MKEALERIAVGTLVVGFSLSLVAVGALVALVVASLLK